MNALVLVGGEGTRLRPLTYDAPKPMLPVVNRPIIARIVEWLSRYGVERAVLSLGYRPDAFINAFPTNSWEGVELSYAVEPTPLDTAGAIRFAAKDAELAADTMVIVNGDILTDLDLGELLRFHRDHGGEATIALTPVDDPSAFGVVPTDVNGRVLAFVEKPPAGSAPTNLINAGTYLFEPSVLSRIEYGRRVSVEREVFPAMVADEVLFAMASSAYWLDTGSPQRYLQAQLDVLHGDRPQVIIPEHDEPHPGVLVARSACCDGELIASVFVGREAQIAKGAVVRESVIGDRCVVGSGSVLENTLLLEGVSIGEQVQCRDVIVGPGARIDDGAVLSGMTVIGASEHVTAGTHLDNARVPV